MNKIKDLQKYIAFAKKSDVMNTLFYKIDDARVDLVQQIEVLEKRFEMSNSIYSEDTYEDLRSITCLLCAALTGLEQLENISYHVEQIEQIRKQQKKE